MIPAVSPFQAILATQHEGKTKVALTQIPRSDLPAGEVLVRVGFSSLNYKDGLAVTGRPGVIRKYPMVPGVDFAGVVEESAVPDVKPGDPVVVTGCGTSETMWGGYAQFARINAEHVLPLPKNMTLKQAMGIGTAGFTAMQSILALEHHGLKISEREVLVTGATGGVGSTAVALLANFGYKVAASTGRPEHHDYLRNLGALEIIDRAALAAASSRPLESERWAGAIDSVGGDTLAGILRSAAMHASIAVCGLAGGPALNTTVFPFILRGVNLLGIDSSKAPRALRQEIWSRLATGMPLDLLDSMIEVIPLAKVFEAGEKILAGQIRGRVVVDVNA